MKRIPYLDGLRGIAILWVIFYHAYVRWINIVPYGDRYSDLLVFNKGWLALPLFFLVSGFVILMTLENTKTLGSFFKKRWLRLFPAMLMATILIYFTASLLPERPGGIPKPESLIPGLTFIDPGWIESITGKNPGVIDGAIWSLFVEVKFYVLIGIFYFMGGKKKAVVCLLICYLLWFAGWLLKEINGVGYPRILDLLIYKLSFRYFGWFLAGTLAWLYVDSKAKKYLYFSLLAAWFSVFSMGESLTDIRIPCAILGTVFIATVYFSFLQRIISNRLFLFLGFITYPLFLIHQNAMVALIVKTGKAFPVIPSLLLPVLPILFLILIAWIIAKLEPKIRTFLRVVNLSKSQIIVNK